MKERYREIRALGAICYTDAYICTTDDQIYMISLFGRSGVVKAVCGTILARVPVTVSFDRKLYTVTRSLMNYHITTCNLKGICHKIIAVHTLFSGKGTTRIIAKDDKDCIFNFIDSKVSTPLKTEWADWMMNQENIVIPTPLVSFDGTGKMDKEYCEFRIPDNDITDEAILDGIRIGAIQ